MKDLTLSREQADRLMSAIAAGLPQLIGLTWDESKHPRVPEGNKDGGKFTDGQGGESRKPMSDEDFEKLGMFDVRPEVRARTREKFPELAKEIDEGTPESRAENAKLKADVELAKSGGGTALAKAAQKKAGIGSAEKKFKPKTGDFAGEQAAKTQFDTAFASIQAHYKMAGWTETKRVGEKREWTIEYVSQGGHKVTVRTSSHNTVDRGVREVSRRNQTYYSINVNHDNSRDHRSAAELDEARAAVANDEDPDIEVIMPEELRACGHETGPFRSLRSTTGKVRRAQLFGEPHLVVPVRALVEGVIFAHGASAPEFVPAEVYSRHAMAWNVRPVMAGHPMVDGVMVSAADPAILDARQIGWTFASSYDSNGRALDMEAWINERRSLALGGEPADVVRRLQRGDTIEVSIGAHVDVDGSATGDYRGRSYRGAWRGISSDHLAFLKAGDRGACSIEMGCGAQRSAADSDPDSLNRAACDGKEHTEDGTAHLDGSPCACRGASTTNDRKDDDMTPITETRAAAFAANPRNIAGATILPFLKTLSEEQATAWEAALPEVKTAPAAPRNAEEYIALAPAGEMRDLLEAGLRSAKAIKAGHVAQLRALGDKRCPYSEEQLNTMTTAQLEQLITLAGIERTEPAAIDFSGRVPRAAQDHDNKPVEAPDPYAPGLKALQGASA